MAINTPLSTFKLPEEAALSRDGADFLSLSLSLLKIHRLGGHFCCCFYFHTFYFLFNVITIFLDCLFLLPSLTRFILFKHTFYSRLTQTFTQFWHTYVFSFSSPFLYFAACNISRFYSVFIHRFNTCFSLWYSRYVRPALSIIRYQVTGRWRFPGVHLFIFSNYVPLLYPRSLLISSSLNLLLLFLLLCTLLFPMFACSFSFIACYWDSPFLSLFVLPSSMFYCFLVFLSYKF